MTRSAVLLSLLGLMLLPANVLASDGQASNGGPTDGDTPPNRGVSIDLRAIEEMAGPEAAAKVDAGIRAQNPKTSNPNTSDMRDATVPTPAVGEGEMLQILYARGNLVISPSAKETLGDWAANFLKADSRIEILSYSGSSAPAWSKSPKSANPENEIATYSLHEAIRTAFKRALVVRDILIARGIPEKNITMRAIGPTGDQGPAERVDVIALKG